MTNRLYLSLVLSALCSRMDAVRQRQRKQSNAADLGVHRG